MINMTESMRMKEVFFSMKRFLVTLFALSLLVGGVTAAQAKAPQDDAKKAGVTCSAPAGGMPAGGCANCPNAPDKAQ